MGRGVGVWTLLTALAVAVPRVRLGTYVLAMPYRNPAMLAKMAETLDEVSGGRVILGVGRGLERARVRVLRVPVGTQVRPVRGGTPDRRCDAPRGAGDRRRQPRAGGVGAARAAGPASRRPARDGRCGWPADASADGRARRRVERWDADARGVRRGTRRSDEALAAVGRDRSTIRRSVEAMVPPGRRGAGRDLTRRGRATRPSPAPRRPSLPASAATASSVRTTSRSRSARTASRRSRRCDR